MRTHCLVLCAQGSRDARERMLFERKRRELEPEAGVVKLAWLRDAEPDLLTVLRRCVGQGFLRVGILPLYLVGCGDSLHRLSCLLEEARGLYPQLTIEVLPPEGRHPRTLVADGCGSGSR